MDCYLIQPEFFFLNQQLLDYEISNIAFPFWGQLLDISCQFF